MVVDHTVGGGAGGGGGGGEREGEGEGRFGGWVSYSY